MICRRIVSVLLAMVLCFACVATAYAETCYVMLKTLCTDPEYETMYIGAGTILSQEDPTTNVMMWYDVDNERLVLSGTNASGKPEVTYWNNIPFDEGLYRIGLAAALYDTAIESIDPGYELTIAILQGEDYSGWLLASSSSEAAALYNAIVETLGK